MYICSTRLRSREKPAAEAAAEAAAATVTASVDLEAVSNHYKQA